ncbi:hypothetical protein [Acidianus manzaensis]|uniref:Uncharacterized protein n=1 Tax=Acidianus manzaensis TaxID=282676 RepID=A0A1W6K2F1_9CREN|nr:hypothetical protein [Acidianus manzaensis]ARM76708.1 hypothetical protein B6F84_12260 [Acidianus manzaensis]
MRSIVILGFIILFTTLISPITLVNSLSNSVNISGKVSLNYPLISNSLQYDGHYLEFFIKMNLRLNGTESITGSNNLSITIISSKLYYIYDNKNYQLFSKMNVSSISTAIYDGKVLLVFIASSPNSSGLYYSLFNGTSWTLPTQLASGYFYSVMTNGSYILALFKQSGFSSLNILVFRDFQFIENINISNKSLDISSGSIVAFGENCIAIQNISSNELLREINSIDGLSSNTFTDYIYIFNFDGKLINKIGPITSALSISNSTDYFITILDIQVSNLTFSEVSLYYVNGKILHSWKINAVVISAYMDYPNIIGIEYAYNLNQLSGSNYMFTLIQVKKNGLWYNYTELINPSIKEEDLSQGKIILNLPIFIGIYSNQIIFENTTLEKNINFNLGQEDLTVSGNPVTKNVDFSKPPEPNVTVSTIQFNGYTLLDISYSIENYSYYGISDVYVIINKSIISTSNLPFNTVSYSITSNGTYKVSVIAENIFGNSTTSKTIEITVKPTAVSHSNVTSTYKENTSSMPNTSSKISTKISSESSVSPITKFSFYIGYVIVAGILISILVILIARKSK